MITVEYEAGRWTAKCFRNGVVVLIFRARKYTDLVAFLAINEPEVA